MVRRAKFRNFSGGLHLKKVSWGKGFLRLMMLAALIATLGLVTPPVAPVSAGGASWYETSGWQYRQEITIDHSRVGIMSALVSDADAGASSIYVEDCSLFSRHDIILLKDDSGSEELLEVFSTVGTSEVKLKDDTVNSYTTDAHACLKNETPGKQGNDLIDFPVLVQITDPDNAIFSHAQEDGDDILFTASDGTTKLPHEIDYYNDGSSGSEELDAWVKVDVDASADTILYMYYGNDSCGNQGSSAVWSEDYVMVQHLQETGRGPETFDDHLDSTFNHNDGELFSGNSIWGENITIEEYDTAYDLTYVPNTYPEPAVFITGLVTKWSYDYYDEGTDFTIAYNTTPATFTALGSGDIPLGKPCNICYSYPCVNDGPTMTATGKIAGADYFDGIDDAIDFYKKPGGGVWNISEAITIQAWVNLEWRPRIGPWEMDNPDYAIISSGTGYEMCLWTEIEGTPPDPTDLVPDEWFQIDGEQYDCCPATNYPNIAVLPDIDEWYLLTGVYDGAELYSYVNAALDYSTSASGLIDGEPDDGLFVGMCSDVNAPVLGIIDEVRVLKEGRDGEWVKACYNNQAYPDVFCSLGAEEQGGVTPTLMEGDVTLDKHVSMADAMFTAQGVVGLVTLNADQLKCADTSDDGSVSMADAMHIAQWVVDPNMLLGVLKVPLWQSPADDDMLPPEPL